MDQSRNDAASPRRFRKGEPTVREGRLSIQEQTFAAGEHRAGQPFSPSLAPQNPTSLRNYVLRFVQGRRLGRPNEDARLRAGGAQRRLAPLLLSLRYAWSARDSSVFGRSGCFSSGP